MHIFSSVRVEVRLLQEEDEADFVSLYMNTRVMRFITKPFSKDKALKSFKSSLKLNSETIFKEYIWCIRDKSTNEFIGIQSLSNLNQHKGKADAGMILSPNYLGQRYSVESFKMMIDYGFDKLNLTTIYASCNSKNKAAIKGIINTGFKLIESNSENSKFMITKLK